MTAENAEIQRKLDEAVEALVIIKTMDTKHPVSHGYCFYTDKPYRQECDPVMGPLASIANNALTSIRKETPNDE